MKRLVFVFLAVLAGGALVWNLFGGLGQSLVGMTAIASVALVVLGLLHSMGRLGSGGQLATYGAWASERSRTSSASHLRSARLAPASYAPMAPREERPASRRNDELCRRDAAAAAVASLRAMHGVEAGLYEVQAAIEEIEGRRKTGRRLRFGLTPTALMLVHGGEGVGKTRFAEGVASLLYGLGVLEREGLVRLTLEEVREAGGGSGVVRERIRLGLKSGLLIDGADWLLVPDDADRAVSVAAQSFWRIAEEEAAKADGQLVVIATSSHPAERLPAFLRERTTLRAMSLPTEFDGEGLARVAGKILAADGVTLDPALFGPLGRALDARSGRAARRPAVIATALSRVAAARGATRLGLGHLEDIKSSIDP